MVVLPSINQAFLLLMQAVATLISEYKYRDNSMDPAMVKVGVMGKGVGFEGKS